MRSGGQEEAWKLPLDLRLLLRLLLVVTVALLLLLLPLHLRGLTPQTRRQSPWQQQ